MTYNNFETLYNVYDEEATVLICENGKTVVTYPDEFEKSYNSYDAAIKALYKRGFHF